MNVSPLISVIIPVYNTELFLRKCLDSVCNQTYKNLQIICVNDGSTDNSQAILDEYAEKDARIAVITQVNQGLSAARNTGLDHAEGEWITGVDSDDYLEEDAYAYALKHAKDDVDIITFGVKVVWLDNLSHDNALEDYLNFTYSTPMEVTPDVLSKCSDVFWNKLWRKSFIDKHKRRFPVGLWHEDAYFWRSLAPYAGKISFCPDKKIFYIQRKGSIMAESAKKSPKSLDRLRVAEGILKIYTTVPLPKTMEDMPLWSFSALYFSATSEVPEDLHPDMYKMARKIARQFHLFKNWPAELRFLQTAPAFIERFYTRSIDKTELKFFGITLLSYKKRNHIETLYFLGIPIKQRTYIF